MHDKRYKTALLTTMLRISKRLSSLLESFEEECERIYTTIFTRFNHLEPILKSFIGEFSLMPKETSLREDRDDQSVTIVLSFNGQKTADMLRRQ